jgi:hypothetical protein
VMSLDLLVSVCFATTSEGYKDCLSIAVFNSVSI